MMNIKRCILKVRLFLSTLYMRPHKEEKGFIYEFNDEEFKELPTEELPDMPERRGAPRTCLSCGHNVVCKAFEANAK